MRGEQASRRPALPGAEEAGREEEDRFDEGEGGLDGGEEEAERKGDEPDERSEDQGEKREGPAEDEEEAPEEEDREGFHGGGGRENTDKAEKLRRESGSETGLLSW